MPATMAPHVQKQSDVSSSREIVVGSSSDMSSSSLTITTLPPEMAPDRSSSSSFKVVSSISSDKPVYSSSPRRTLRATFDVPPETGAALRSPTFNQDEEATLSSGHDDEELPPPCAFGTSSAEPALPPPNNMPATKLHCWDTPPPTAALKANISSGIRLDWSADAVPLVGRAAQLQTLRDCLHVLEQDDDDNARVQLVLLSGASGTGKTTLCRRFRQTLPTNVLYSRVSFPAAPPITSHASAAPDNCQHNKRRLHHQHQPESARSERCLPTQRDHTIRRTSLSDSAPAQLGATYASSSSASTTGTLEVWHSLDQLVQQVLALDKIVWTERLQQGLKCEIYLLATVLPTLQPLAADWQAQQKKRQCIRPPATAPLTASLATTTTSMMIMSDAAPPAVAAVFDLQTVPSSSNGQGDGTGHDYSWDRLRMATRQLVRVLSHNRTVVWELDHCHHLQPPEAALVRSILKDSGNSRNDSAMPQQRRRRLLVIMCGVDATTASTMPTEECSSTTLLHSQLLHNLPTSLEIQSLHLGNFDVPQLQDLIAQLFQRDHDDDATREFATVLHRKTAGNPFFVLQFLRHLESRGSQDGLLFYNVRSLRWEWHVAGLRALHVADNVASMVTQQLQNSLGVMEQQILVTAACLGPGRFDVETLWRVSGLVEDNDNEGDVFGASRSSLIDEDENTREELQDLLNLLVDEGYLERLVTNDEYKFAHERIREVAARLLPPHHVTTTHLHMGRKLREWIHERAETGRQPDDRLLLRTVQHLNLGCARIQDAEEKLDLVELNLEATEVAVRRCSLYPARGFLVTGFELLGDDPWTDYYDWAKRIRVAMVRIEYNCGRHDSSLQIADEVLQHVKSLEDTRVVYQTKMLCLSQQDSINAAIEVAHAVLAELHSPLPRRNLKYHVYRELMAVHRVLRRLDKGEQIHATAVPAKLLHVNDVIEFLHSLGELLRSADRSHDDLAAIVTMRSFSLAIKFGRTAVTAHCLVDLACFFAKRGQLQLADRLGRRGLRLAERSRGSSSNRRAILLYYQEIHHWTQPYHDGLSPTSRTLKQLWDAGNLETLFNYTPAYLSIYFCAGLCIQPLVVDMRKYITLLRDCGCIQDLRKHLPFFLMVCHLMGSPPEALDLSDDFIVTALPPESSTVPATASVIRSTLAWSEKHLKGQDQAYMSRFLQKARACDMMLSYTFYDVDKAQKLSDDLAGCTPQDSSGWVPYHVFFRGMIALEAYTMTKALCLRRLASRCLQQLQKWYKQGNVNVMHLLELLQAEHVASLPRTRNDPVLVQRAYDKAVACAGRRGFVPIQGLANERAGIYFKTRDPQWAAVYLERSRDLNIEWGAFAKVEQLTSAHPDIFAMIENNSADRQLSSSLSGAPGGDRAAGAGRATMQSKYAGTHRARPQFRYQFSSEAFYAPAATTISESV